MNIKNPILSELESLAPILINVPKTIPYAIQNGYFDDLANRILDRIKNENIGVTYSFTIDNKILIPPYAIPENYFSTFADTVLAKVKFETDNGYFSIIPSSSITPYKVPTGFFNNLSNTILEKINLLEQNEAVFFEKINTITPYQIPVGYFKTLSDNILDRIKEIENDEDFVVSTNFTKINPYKVPIGYFEGLANEVLAKLSGPTKKQDVPEGYFESLPNIMLQKVRGLEVESELKEIAPLLNTISKLPVNHIPVGYFETLQPVQQVSVVPVTVSSDAKVISIKKKFGWFKNAIAACLIGTLGFTAYQMMATTKTVTAIQTASNAEIEVKLPTNINVDEELSKVDDVSLAKYLDNIEMPTEQATAHFNDVNSGDVDAALQDIPDETIQQHLDETGGLVDKKN